MLLAFFKRYGVYDHAAGYILKGGFYYLEIRRVYHPRHGGNLGVGGEKTQEMCHFGFSVEHSVVKVDVEYHSAVGHLLACYGYGVGVGFFFDKPQEFAAAGNVAALADVDEAAVVGEVVEAGEPRYVWVGNGAWGGEQVNGAAQCGDVGRRGAAAAAGDVYHAVAQERA